MGKPEVRMVQATDEAAWRELWAGYLAFYKTVLSPAVTSTTFARLLDANVPIWGALALNDEGRPIGLVNYLYHYSSWSPTSYCYLEDLYVDPAARRAGAGRALIQHVFDAADEVGATRVYWHTHTANARARSLYDQMAVYEGFIHYGRQDSQG